MRRSIFDATNKIAPAVWFPLVRTGAGVDVFTERLCRGLSDMGIRAEITWLPHRAEYLPWTVPVPKPPAWANVVHVNTWLHPRFIPDHLPIVATLHHSVHDPALRPYKGRLRAAYHRWWIAPIERHALQRANCGVAVSRFAAEMAHQVLCDVPLQVIYNGIDTELFRPGRRQRRAGEPFRLLYVGSWMKRKGVDLLVPIMRELGEGFVLSYTGGAAAQAVGANMPGNMIDIGRLQGGAAVVAAMQRADAFLFPSRSEGFGLVVAEAMACGLPVVAARIAPLREVVDDRETGLLCPLDDVTGFVAAIKRLSNDELLMTAMRSAARNWVLERFSYKAMLEKYLDVYFRVISAPLSLAS